MANLRTLNNYGKDVKITTLYVRSVEGKDRAQKLRRDDIFSHFSAFGDVTSVRLNSKPKRSYSFVKFAQTESAAKAFQIKIHTIAGRRVEIDVAYPRYQDCVSLLDLNNDCLFGIFSEKCLSIKDLCSVAETSRRLKGIAGKVFKRQCKKCNLNVLTPRSGEYVRVRFDVKRYSAREDSAAKRILVNFGSVISELQIDGFEFKDNERTEMLDFVTRYCSDSLESLTLHSFDIPESYADKLQPMFNKLRKFKMTRCTFEGASKELFTDCPAMVELVVYYDEDMTFITEKTFPNLQHFEFEYQPYRPAQVEINFESFLSRHQNLQVLNIWRCSNEGSSLPQSIADNYTQLEELHCNMQKDTTFDLSNLGRLRKLQINFAKQSVTKSSLGWNNLNYLVDIKLEDVNVDSEFVRFLSQLRKLQVLELVECTGIENLQQMDDMNQLIKLKITSYEPVYDFDLVRLIQRLGNLKYLTVDTSYYDCLDTETYLRIVEIVGRRSDKSKLHFRFFNSCEYYGEMDEIVFHQNRELVEMQLGCGCYD